MPLPWRFFIQDQEVNLGHPNKCLRKVLPRNLSLKFKRGSPKKCPLMGKIKKSFKPQLGENYIPFPKKGLNKNKVLC